MLSNSRGNFIISLFEQIADNIKKFAIIDLYNKKI